MLEKGIFANKNEAIMLSKSENLPPLRVTGSKKYLSPRAAGTSPKGVNKTNNFFWSTDTKPECLTSLFAPEPQRGHSNLCECAERLHNDSIECQRIGDVQWLTCESVRYIRNEIYTILEETMCQKKHHTTLHAEIMGEYARKAMQVLRQPKGMQNLAYLIGLSHDVIQAQGWKNNEYDSANLLVEKLKQCPGFRNLTPRMKECVPKFILQSICSFTTLDFNTLQTFGENKISQDNIENETVLIKFGKKLAYNDLFSKIDYFGKPENFGRIGNLGHCLSPGDCKLVMLVVQMYQVNSEFNSPLIQQIDTSIPEEKGRGLSALICHETRENGGFWREGMPPCQQMKELLGCDESVALEPLLQEKLLDQKVLQAIQQTIEFLNNLGNPSYDQLREIGLTDDTSARPTAGTVQILTLPPAPNTKTYKGHHTLSGYEHRNTTTKTK